MHELSLTFAVKSAALLLVFTMSNAYVSLAVLLGYRYVIALVLQLKVMPVMDMGTFFSLQKAPLNIMAAITFTKGTTSDKVIESYGRVVPQHYKMCSKIRVVMGDYYYEKMDMPADQIHKERITVLAPGTLKT